MCGIFGYSDFVHDEISKARRALNTLKHRGPDQWGDWYDNHVYMGHRRLSIIDLSENGRQPMANKDNSVIIMVNGEIYNFRQIRKELVSKYNFKSTSDSEVILHGYTEWGIDELMERIDGMYAIVIYDRIRKALFLIRDRFGQKPLYYTIHNNRIIFSSEIKAIFEFESTLRAFSYSGIKEWIYYRGWHTSNTIYHNIFSVLPSEYLIIENDCNVKRVNYYNLFGNIISGKTATNNSKSKIDQLSHFLSKSINKRMMSDVPVGIMLSGGIDSSILSYKINSHKKNVNHGFTICFEDKLHINYDEREYAANIAKRNGIRHHLIELNNENIKEAFINTIYSTDGMYDHPSSLAINILCNYAKKYVSVLLSGDGADELFGGYIKFKTVLNILDNKTLMSLLPLPFIKNYLGKLSPNVARMTYLSKYYKNNQNLILNDINCYISPNIFNNIFGEVNVNNEKDSRIQNLPIHKKLILNDYTGYLRSLLDMGDRTSMLNSIELRHPFLDKNLFEWAIQLDQNYLFNKNESKIILKKLFSKYYGSDILIRPKKGFSMPINHWMCKNGPLSNYHQKIFSSDFVLNKFIDKKYLNEYYKSDRFDNCQLNYANSSKMWVSWFLMVLRTTQDVFNINDIYD